MTNSLGMILFIFLMNKTRFVKQFCTQIKHQPTSTTLYISLYQGASYPYLCVSIMPKYLCVW